MRGKLIEDALIDARIRITPAHAGKTLGRKNPCCAAADHPRACGENAGVNPLAESSPLSPPRMRGKRLREHIDREIPRITPAHAGKTRPPAFCTQISSDHPRACGENAFLVSLLYSSHGSPPRMRGKPPRPDSLRGAHRITPAHAGKTRRMCWPTRISADHPRACGENTASASPAGAAPGSPPRMRGKHPHQSNLSGNLRITPAHAGKTTAGLSRSLPISDHPRACGENGDDSITAWRLNGSPPRMRGKLNSEREKSRLKRITPAHAGKTVRPQSQCRARSDHPRACGENVRAGHSI